MAWHQTPLLLTPAIVAAQPAIHRLVRRDIPRLADFGGVFIAFPPSIVCVASAHVTREGTRVLRTLMRAYRIARDDRGSTVAHVIRTSTPVLRTGIQPEPRQSERGDLIGELHRRLAPRSALTLPIVANEGVLGALSLCYAQSGRSYLSRDIPMAARLAARIAGVLASVPADDAAVRLRATAGHTRQGTTVRRRVGSRD
jgi:GAF domain-containing protein